MSIAPEDIVIVAAAVFCILIVGAVFLLVRSGNRGRIRIDVMAAANGDVPGFSREQLARFQSDIHGERLRESRGSL